MKLHLTIFAPCNGGAVLSEAFFNVVSVGEPFAAPGIFGTGDPFKTVLYKDDAGIVRSQYIHEGSGLTNIYTDDLAYRYELINK